MLVARLVQQAVLSRVNKSKCNAKIASLVNDKDNRAGWEVVSLSKSIPSTRRRHFTSSDAIADQEPERKCSLNVEEDAAAREFVMKLCKI
jgi:hypothetical protein